MTNDERLPALLLKRKAVVYVRQSTQTQVQMNVESKRRQYDLDRKPSDADSVTLKSSTTISGARRAVWWLDRASSVWSRCCVPAWSERYCARTPHVSLGTGATGIIFWSSVVLSKRASSTSTVCTIRAGQTTACC
ncbi:hypothetical protein LMG28138_06097 [Pararobbsia alpina]|uniref:Resolvase/invertase-type recombinase catalytic domain-containing protein n=1 Tax=Pararobbsia alpina TaxID=621374 RepID=A0A6S7CGW9_9BURK|nr:hypothetical protein LMG28138_06097 [Pararobbsia alpina]